MGSLNSFSRRYLTSSLMVFPLLIILSLVAYCEVGRPSAYEVLQQYDFPIGILPLGVTGYEYEHIISGVLSKGRLNDLKGVSVKVLFFWLSILEVVYVGNDLQLSVGIASTNFPANNFEERPQCGCGFLCDQLSIVLPSYPVATY